jgi:hypothetical protein
MSVGPLSTNVFNTSIAEFDNFDVSISDIILI